MTAGYSTVIDDTVKIRLTISVDDVLTDPASYVFTVDAPDGSDSTPTSVNESTGVWSCTFSVDQAGVYRWRATGNGPASFLREGSFYVASTHVVAF